MNKRMEGIDKRIAEWKNWENRKEQKAKKKKIKASIKII